MSFSYNMSQLATNDLYRARFELGDTDPNNPLIQDEELKFCLAQVTGFYRACAMAAYAVARKFAREASINAGALRIDLSQRATAWRVMADQFIVQAQDETTQREPLAGGLPDPTAGPDFFRGMHDFPGTTIYSGAGGRTQWSPLSSD